MTNKLRRAGLWYINQDEAGPVVLDTAVVDGKHQLKVSGGGGGGGGGGDASAANQLAGNASLASIDAKLPAAQLSRLPVYAWGLRQDAPTPYANNGEAHPFLFNEDGRLKVAATPAQYAPVTGAITASAQTVVADVSAASNVMVYVTGTFAGHNCAFEGSIDGGTSWFGMRAVRSNANTVETSTGVLAAAPAYAWELSVNALTNFRVRATAHGSGTANWRFTLGTYATEPTVSFTQPALVAGSAAVGDVGVQVRANATGAATIAKVTAGASTNATLVKATAGRVLGWCLTNTTAAVKVVRLFNMTTAPTVGTSVPAYNIVLPANATVALSIPAGMAHATGISYAITGALADLDATAVAANDVIGSIHYA